MRLLLKSEEGTLEVMEASYITYNSDMLGEELLPKITGLSFAEDSGDDHWWHIPNISKETAEKICLEAFQTGMVDLTPYGTYYDDDYISSIENK